MQTIFYWVFHGRGVIAIYEGSVGHLFFPEKTNPSEAALLAGVTYEIFKT